MLGLFGWTLLEEHQAKTQQQKTETPITPPTPGVFNPSTGGPSPNTTTLIPTYRGGQYTRLTQQQILNRRREGIGPPDYEYGRPAQLLVPLNIFDQQYKGIFAAENTSVYSQ